VFADTQTDVSVVLGCLRRTRSKDSGHSCKMLLLRRHPFASAARTDRPTDVLYGIQSPRMHARTRLRGCGRRNFLPTPLPSLYMYVHRQAVHACRAVRVA
jgi:hypothetical protein